MQIVRYQTTTGQTAYGRLHADGRTIGLTGEIFGGLTSSVRFEIDGIGSLTNPVIAEGE